MTSKPNKTSEFSLGADAPNPYNFRDAVKDAGRLAGRDRELREVRKHLRNAQRGGSGHIALVGSRSAGKTSLLNVIEPLAIEENLLPVRFDLDDNVVSSPVTFFKSLIDSVLQRLKATDEAISGAGWYQAWRLRAHGGDLAADLPGELLDLGLIAAAELNGRQAADVPTALLAHDFSVLAARAADQGFSGIVLLVDEADVLGRAVALLEKIRNLIQSTPGWTLVLAGTDDLFTHVTDVFSPLPRHFAAIRVVGYRSPLQVRRCIMAPLPGEVREELQLSFHTIDDIFRLTGGEPYEINLVCHYMWEAAQAGGFADFAPSVAVLDRVFAELATLGRHEEHRSLVEAVRNLAPRNFRTVLATVPYEKLTVRELALTRLLPHDYTEHEFTEEVERVQAQLQELSALGLLSCEGDRFHLQGDSFVRIYLKYAAIRAIGGDAEHLTFGTHFIQFVVAAFSDLIQADVLGSKDEGQLLALGTHLVEFDEAEHRGHHLDQFIAGVAAKSFPDMTDIGLLFRWDPDTVESIEANGALAVGFALSCGFEQAELLLVATNPSGRSEEEIRAALEDELEQLRPLLLKYDITSTRAIACVIDPETTSSFWAYSMPQSMRTLLMQRFAADDIEGAARIARTVLATIEQHGLPRPYKVDTADFVADFTNSVGFLALVEGDGSTAATAFRAALELNENERWLRLANLGSAEALRGDYTASSRAYEEAIEALAEDLEWTGSAWLIFVPPVIPGWVPPNAKWRVVSVTPPDVRLFLEAQRDVVRAVAGGLALDALFEALESVPDVAVIHRLAAWSYAALRNDSQDVSRHLAAARSLAPEDSDTIDAEHSFLLSGAEPLQARETVVEPSAAAETLNSPTAA